MGFSSRIACLVSCSCLAIVSGLAVVLDFCVMMADRGESNARSLAAAEIFSAGESAPMDSDLSSLRAPHSAEY